MQSNAHKDFVDIKNGEKEAKYDFMLEEVTSDTHGLYLYQEQIMKAVVVLGGFSLVEADTVRTIMKKFDVKKMKTYQDKFIDGAVKKGCGEKEAEKIWNKLLSFSGYGFNMSHSAAYAVTGYNSQWFKTYYPLEFYTTELTFAKDEKSIPYIVQEMSVVDPSITLMPPDVNVSDLVFNCDPSENKIYFSLTTIKGMGDKKIIALLKERNEGGHFFSISEFMKRMKSKSINSSDVVNLVLSGAFDSICGNKGVEWRNEMLLEYRDSVTTDVSFDFSQLPFSYAQLILRQRRLIGHYEIDFLKFVRSVCPEEISEYFLTYKKMKLPKNESKLCWSGGFVRDVYVKLTRKGDEFLNIVVDQNSETIEMIVWNDTYEKYKDDLSNISEGDLFLMLGKVNLDKVKGRAGLQSQRETEFFIAS